eukprot:scaffold3345_cov164-Ochromonas_danica.AAC.7
MSDTFMIDIVKDFSRLEGLIVHVRHYSLRAIHNMDVLQAQSLQIAKVITDDRSALEELLQEIEEEKWLPTSRVFLINGDDYTFEYCMMIREGCFGQLLNVESKLVDMI